MLDIGLGNFQRLSARNRLPGRSRYKSRQASDQKDTWNFRQSHASPTADDLHHLTLLFFFVELRFNRSLDFLVERLVILQRFLGGVPALRKLRPLII